MLVMVGDVAMVATSDVVSVTESVTALNVAEIVVAPGAVTAVARPEALTVANGADESQAAKDVRSCTTLLASVPSAWNCCVMVGARLFGAAGDRDSETTSDVVRTVDPVTPVYTAVMMAEPVVEDIAVTRPVELTVAIPGSDEVHVASEVRTAVAWFEYVPRAVN